MRCCREARWERASRGRGRCQRGGERRGNVALEGRGGRGVFAYVVVNGGVVL